MNRDQIEPDGQIPVLAHVPKFWTATSFLGSIAKWVFICPGQVDKLQMINWIVLSRYTGQFTGLCHTIDEMLYYFRIDSNCQFCSLNGYIY